jgi:prepilin-type N-terminal cleavage/methylation domain-containing protein
LLRQFSEQPNKRVNRNLRARADRGFTLVELVVVVTIIGLLAAMAVVVFNSAVNNAKSTKSNALVNTLATAKSLFVADPETTSANVTAYNTAVNGGNLLAAFTFIAPYIRVNGAQPIDAIDLLGKSGMPTDGSITITLGTVDDSSFNATSPSPDVAPTVTGYP